MIVLQEGKQLVLAGEDVKALKDFIGAAERLLKSSVSNSVTVTDLRKTYNHLLKTLATVNLENEDISNSGTIRKTS